MMNEIDVLEYINLTACLDNKEIKNINVYLRHAKLTNDIFKEQPKHREVQEELRPYPILLKAYLSQDIWNDCFVKLCDSIVGGRVKADVLERFLYFNRRADFFRDIIRNGYTWSTPRKVEIPKPGTNKKRIVYMQQPVDRLFTGVLNTILTEEFNTEMVSNLFSYRTGCSTSKAVQKVLQDFSDTFGKKQIYGIKADISKYFNSVPLNRIHILLNNIHNTVSDEIVNSLLKDLFNITEVLIKGRNKTVEEFMSLIPGNPLSCVLSNLYLSDLDKHYTNRKDCVYVRYCDDILILTDNPKEVNKFSKDIREQIQKYELTINPEKIQEITKSDTYINFLGYKISTQPSTEQSESTYNIDVGDNSFKNLKHKIKHIYNLQKKESNKEQATRDLLSIINYALYDCITTDSRLYGWCACVFRGINTIERLRELDFYIVNTARALLNNGKHNSSSISKFPLEYLKELGYTSLVKMYSLYKADKDLYLDQVYNLTHAVTERRNVK